MCVCVCVCVCAHLYVRERVCNFDCNPPPKFESNFTQTRPASRLDGEQLHSPDALQLSLLPRLSRQLVPQGLDLLCRLESVRQLRLVQLRRKHKFDPVSMDHTRTHNKRRRKKLSAEHAVYKPHISF